MALQFQEKDVEDYIMNNYHAIFLEWFETPDPTLITGLSCWQCSRQIGLGGYGIADIVAVQWWNDSVVRIKVLELKIERPKAIHFAQLSRYMQGVRHFLPDILGARYERRLPFQVDDRFAGEFGSDGHIRGPAKLPVIVEGVLITRDYPRNGGTDPTCYLSYAVEESIFHMTYDVTFESGIVLGFAGVWTPTDNRISHHLADILYDMRSDD